MPKLETFDWAELFSLVSVVIAFATIYFSTRSRSTAEAQNEQRMIDKLDRLSDMSKDTNVAVKEINQKIDDHATRLATLESENVTIFRRLDRIEETQDRCQACRAAKQQVVGEGN